ncbi:MAG: sensor histidine kinase [Rhizobiaceae bacterium]
MNSIRTKLLVWLLVPLTAIAAIVSLETFYAAKRISNDLHDRTLLAAMLTLSENIVASSGSLLADTTLEMLTDNLGDEFFYYVKGPEGAFVTGYSGYPRPPDGVELTDGEPVFYDGEYAGAPVRVVAVRQLLAGRELNGWTTITTWQQNTKRDELTLSLFARSLIRLVSLVLAAGAIVWFAVSVGLRPLIQLQRAIENRTPYDLNPIKRKMPIELSGIVSSMNELFARVARSKKNRERFIGNAAHQLRNPVAAIKVQAQAALASGTKKDLQSGLEQIAETSDETGKLINQMLAGASAHALSQESMEDFDLAKTVSNATQTVAANALDKGQEISLNLSPEILPYRGNEILLQEAIVNLVENAIRHNDKNTAIDVSLSVQDDNIEISVADNGRVFSQEEFLELSQPFLTGGENQNGSGLGLSISKDIAKSHGGYLATFPGTTGKKISIILPNETFHNS